MSHDENRQSRWIKAHSIQDTNGDPVSQGAFNAMQEAMNKQAAEAKRLQAIVDLAVAWRQSFTHSRDICDEGISVADETHENTLYDAIEKYEAEKSELDREFTNLSE